MTAPYRAAGVVELTLQDRLQDAAHKLAAAHLTRARAKQARILAEEAVVRAEQDVEFCQEELMSLVEDEGNASRS